MTTPWKVLVPMLAFAVLAAGCPQVVQPDSSWTLTVRVEGSGTVDVAGEACSDECGHEVDAGAAATLVATAAAGAVFAGWEGCDLAVGDVCEVAGDEAVTVTARFAEATGSVAVSFSGLPAPWAAQGYAVLVAPGGQRTSIAAATTLADVPVGTYRLEPRPIPLCGTTYAPSTGAVDLQVTAGATAAAQVAYAPSTLGTLGFRARVVGVHNVASITEPIEADATLVIAGDALVTFACVRYYEVEDFEQGPTTGGDVRLGRPQDFPAASEVISTLVAGPEACTPTDRFDEPAVDCTVLLAGSQPLTTQQQAMLSAGPAFVHFAAPAAQGGHVLAAIEPDGDAAFTTAAASATP